MSRKFKHEDRMSLINSMGTLFTVYPRNSIRYIAAFTEKNNRSWIEELRE